jgi:hypothetical protein
VTGDGTTKLVRHTAFADGTVFKGHNIILYLFHGLLATSPLVNSTYHHSSFKGQAGTLRRQGRRSVGIRTFPGALTPLDYRPLLRVQAGKCAVIVVLQVAYIL